MRPFHATAQGNVPFTDEEMAQLAIDEAAAQAATPEPVKTKEQLMAEVQALAAQVQAFK